LKEYVRDCSDTLPLLFDHQSDDHTRKASSIAQCVGSGDIDDVVSMWTHSAVEYQAEKMSQRFDNIACPALGAAAVAILRGKASGEVAGLAVELVKDYLEEGCDAGSADMGLTCTKDRLELQLSETFKTQLGEKAVADLRREFRKGTKRLGVHEVIRDAHCWKPVPVERENVMDKALNRMGSDTAKILSSTWKAFQEVPGHGKDVAALNAVMSGGGGGIIFATGLPGLAVASAWLAFRFNVAFVSKIDFNDACRDGAMFMSGMMEASFCSITIEKAFSTREDKNQDMSIFVRSVLDKGSNDEKLMACLLGEEEGREDVNSESVEKLADRRTEKEKEEEADHVAAERAAAQKAAAEMAERAAAARAAAARAAAEKEEEEEEEEGEEGGEKGEDEHEVQEGEKEEGEGKEEGEEGE